MTYTTGVEGMQVPASFQPPKFESVEHFQKMSQEEATGLYIHAGMRLRDILTTQSSNHYHPHDDCGDDLDQSSMFWDIMHTAFFGTDGLWNQEDRDNLVKALMDKEVDVYRTWLDYLPDEVRDSMEEAEDND